MGRSWLRANISTFTYPVIDLHATVNKMRTLAYLTLGGYAGSKDQLHMNSVCGAFLVMNWKTDLRLYDLDDDTELECTCKKCGHVHYENSTELMNREEFKQLYLDEVETRLRCSVPFCKGNVRIALIHDDDVEGFVGGLA